MHVDLYRHYGHGTGFYVRGFPDGELDEDKAKEWAKNKTPKFIYISDYDMWGNQIELDQLKARWDRVGRKNRHELTNEDQTILIILDLGKIELDDFLEKGQSAQ